MEEKAKATGNYWQSREAIAANLATAVHLHILTMQLQGKTVTVPEAILAVRSTWLQLLHDETVLGAAHPDSRPHG